MRSGRLWRQSLEGYANPHERPHAAWPGLSKKQPFRPIGKLLRTHAASSSTTSRWLEAASMRLSTLLMLS